jgi:hypothetical protein
VETTLRLLTVEPHQAVSDGVVERVTLINGRVDKELDWHVHLGLSWDVARRLGRFIRETASPSTTSAAERPDPGRATAAHRNLRRLPCP